MPAPPNHNTRWLNHTTGMQKHLQSTTPAPSLSDLASHLARHLTQDPRDPQFEAHALKTAERMERLHVHAVSIWGLGPMPDDWVLINNLRNILLGDMGNRTWDPDDFVQALQDAWRCDYETFHNPHNPHQAYEACLNPLLHHWFTCGAPEIPSNHRTRPLLHLGTTAQSRHAQDHKWGAGLPAHIVRKAKPHPQLVLPGFEQDHNQERMIVPTDILDLGVQGDKGRRSVATPMSQRIFWESLLSINRDHWDTGGIIKPSLGEVLNWLYPTARTPRPVEYLPRLHQAKKDLSDFMLPIRRHNPQNDEEYLAAMQIVQVWEYPLEGGAHLLEHPVVIQVNLPYQENDLGAPIHRQALRELAAHSAAEHRMYLNLSVNLFRPGHTFHNRVWRMGQ